MSGRTPIIGITGGIGGGKSHVARMLQSMGCVVIDSDTLAHQAYDDPQIRSLVRELVGVGAFDANGKIDRSALGRQVFANASTRRAIEAAVHPWIGRRREQIMRERAGDPSVRAFVWDSPLLLETGLDERCDVVLFVDTPASERLRRVQVSRGWDAHELARREASQWPIDRKRARSDTSIPGDLPDAELRLKLEHLLHQWTTDADSAD